MYSSKKYTENELKTLENLTITFFKKFAIIPWNTNHSIQYSD